MIILQRQWGSLLHGAPFEIVDYYTLFEPQWSRVKFELDPEERERESLVIVISRNNVCLRYIVIARRKFDCERRAILQDRIKSNNAKVQVKKIVCLTEL